MSNIFISYCHDDKEYAHRLEKALVKQGFKVWIDDRIDFGTEWPKVIQERLDSCKILILIMTPRSSKSIWVQNELTRAQRKRKIIYPLLLEGEEPWLQVETLKYVDVRDTSLPSEPFYEILRNYLQEKKDISSTKISQNKLINEIVKVLNEFHEISKSKSNRESGFSLWVGNIRISISMHYPDIHTPMPDREPIPLRLGLPLRLERPPISWEVPEEEKVEHPPNSSCTIDALILIYKDPPLTKNKKQKLHGMQWIVDELAVRYLKINNVSSYLKREWKADQGIEFSSILMENIAEDLIAANKVIMGKSSKIEVVLSPVKNNE